eukprot:m.258374 g.258374  ORF g.258374 m.258374 type:complete len:256 (-) comp19190_c0_seq1:162-929(-)
MAQVSELWAFDFDGVVCDSAHETGVTALRALRRLVPEQAPGSGDDVSHILKGFETVRPSLETGWEAVVIVYLLHKGGDPDDLVNTFTAIKQSAIKELGTSADELKRVFQLVREDWTENALDEWLALHRFYPDAVDAVQTLLARPGTAVYVITTKAKEFAVQLLSAAGLAVPHDRVFGLGSGPKADVLGQALTEHGLEPASCWFFEDRLKTLEAVSLAAPNIHLRLCDWGYNTPAHRARAVALGIPVIAASQILER